MSINEKQFINLYNNHSITTKEIRKILGLEYNEFYKYRKKLQKQGKIKPRNFKRTPKQKETPKYYCLNNCRTSYQIRKKGKYYGCCKTIKQAKRMVELLEENNWNINLRDEIKKQAYKEFPA